MKYFLDTEFIERPNTIDLISIGIVAEDGREYYAINKDCDWLKASPWVKENVLAHMPRIEYDTWDLGPGVLGIGVKEKFVPPEYKTLHEIKMEVLRFVNMGLPDIPTHEQVKVKHEFWGYYADYDWVVFCWIFGTMMELPPNFPMYCRDVKQLCDYLGNPKLPKQADGLHNALADARHVKVMYDFLRYQTPKGVMTSEEIKG